HQIQDPSLADISCFHQGLENFQHHKIQNSDSQEPISPYLCHNLGSSAKIEKNQKNPGGQTDCFKNSVSFPHFFIPALCCFIQHFHGRPRKKPSPAFFESRCPSGEEPEAHRRLFRK